jgi:MFS family permease
VEFCDLKLHYFAKKPDFSDPRTLHNWVEQLDMYCYTKNTIEVIGSSFFAGAFAGSFVLPRLSDVYGRRPLFLTGLVLYFAVLIGCLCATGFYEMCFYVFMGGVAETGRYYVAYVYAVEMMPKKQQSNCGLYVFVVFGCLQMFFSSYFALISKQWMYLDYAAMAIVFMSFATTLAFLPESPRFLYTKNRFAEAKQTLDYIQKMNTGSIKLEF